MIKHLAHSQLPNQDLQCSCFPVSSWPVAADELLPLDSRAGWTSPLGVLPLPSTGCPASSATMTTSCDVGQGGAREARYISAQKVQGRRSADSRNNGSQRLYIRCSRNTQTELVEIQGQRGYRRWWGSHSPRGAGAGSAKCVTDVAGTAGDLRYLVTDDAGRRW
jgi:hypothetical protein